MLVLDRLLRQQTVWQHPAIYG